MSLQEIIRRFVKRESLPMSKEGTYEDRYDYDLEKLAKADRTIQDEVVDDLKSQVKAADKKITDNRNAQLAKEQAVKEAELLKASSPVKPPLANLPG